MIVIDAACDQEVTPQLDNGAWNNKMPLKRMQVCFYNSDVPDDQSLYLTH